MTGGGLTLEKMADRRTLNVHCLSQQPTGRKRAGRLVVATHVRVVVDRCSKIGCVHGGAQSGLLLTIEELRRA